MAPPKRPTPTPTASGPNFGSLDFYVAGGGMPEGDYALEFIVLMFQAKKLTGANAGPERLGVQIKAHPLAGGEPREQFYSMGGNAHLSFQPDPETGKGLVAVPGGPGSNLNNQTNWAIFLRSLYDSGLPIGIFENDLSVLDGVHVHMANIPEPEERKGFGASKTGEAGEERKPGLIAVVTEIKEDGKPWEGTGGLDIAAPKAAPKAGPKAVAAPAKKAAPAPVAEETGEGEDVSEAAIQGTSSVLEKSPQGVTKLALRTGTFKAVNEKLGGEMANAVINTYFGSDDTLNVLLGQLGYVVAGGQVKPQA